MDTHIMLEFEPESVVKAAVHMLIRVMPACRDRRMTLSLRQQQQQHRAGCAVEEFQRNVLKCFGQAVGEE